MTHPTRSLKLTHTRRRHPPTLTPTRLSPPARLQTHARPLWRELFRIAAALGLASEFAQSDTRRYVGEIIILNCYKGTLLPPQACALIRHTVRFYYRDVTQVSTEKRVFVWQETLVDALRSFRGAVIRWALAFKRMYTSRVHTHLTEIAPQKEREKNGNLVDVNEDGTYTLTTAFTTTIANAESAAIRQHPTPPPPPAPPPPRRAGH